LPNFFFFVIFVANLLPNVHFCCPNWKGNKLGENFWRKLDSTLSDKDKKFAEAFDKHYQRLYKVANAAWEERYGTSLPYNEFYSPSRVEGFAQDKQSKPGLNGYEHSSIIPSAAYTRTNNKLALAPMNAYSAAMSHTQQWALFAGWGETVQRNTQLLANEKFRKAVSLKFGQGTLQALQGHHDTFIKGRGEMNNAVNQMVNKLRSAMFVTVLGFKALQAPVQMMSAFMVQGRYEVGGKEFWVDTSDILDAMADLAFLRDPYETLLEP